MRAFNARRINMGLFELLKGKSKINSDTNSTVKARNSPDSYIDSSTVSADERPFYQEDSYYTYYSYPGTDMAVRVIPFDERKKTTYPSARGLYVAEIMLLEYCRNGKYPKPSSGYPGFWWFKYGIRDIGHALESLEKRGFIQWASKIESLGELKIDVLKQILINSCLPATGKKADLIDRIKNEITEEQLIIPDYIPKYRLTEIGKKELEENGYVPYMHNHNHLTTEDSRFGKTFTVWDINKQFPDGNAKNWRKVVGRIEKERFGVNMADAVPKEVSPSSSKMDIYKQRDEMRQYLAEKKKEINKGIKTKGDGFAEESQGLDYKRIGKDKEALVQFFISIGKGFDAPALYREAAVLLRKYRMYEEELAVIEAGIKNVPHNSREQLMERKEKVKKLLNTNS